MGVVHKLTDEVIDYITALKQSDPKLSCRKISDLVNEKFGLQVSKSSVNNILKDAHLSSSVGRRSKKEEEKQFKIPEQKKSQLLAEIQKLKPRSKRENKESVKPKKSPKPLPQAKPKPKRLAAKENLQQPLEEVVKGPVQTELNSYPDKIKRQRNAFFANFSETYPNLGYIVFKAAQWSLSDQPVLARILKSITEYYPINHDDQYCESIFNSLLVDQEDIRRNIGLDAVSEIDERVIRTADLHSRREWMRAVNISRHSRISLKNEMQQLLVRVSGYVFTFASGEEVFIDAALQTVSENPLNIKQSIFLDRAMANISDFFVSNRKTPCFSENPQNGTANGVELYEKLFLKQKDNKIEKITLLDIKGHELTSFNHIPHFNRNFTVGFWPKTDFYEKASQTSKWSGKNQMYVPELDRVFWYVHADGKNSDGAGFTKIIVWDDPSSLPIIVIYSNAEASVMYTMRQYLVTYAGRFIGQPGNNEDISDHDIMALKDVETNMTTEMALIAFKELVSDLINKEYFTNYCISDVYDKSGRFFISPHAVIVYLDGISQGKNVQLLNKINLGGFYTHSGRKILLFSS